jgi:dTDP-4-dehydrorhamnose 3,5-epimerase
MVTPDAGAEVATDATLKHASVAKAPLIKDVVLKPLRVVPDERGFLMEVMRSDDDFFKGFGQAYISATYPGVVKAWHFHRQQIDNFACIAGMVKLVLIDQRPDSPTTGVVNEFFLGSLNPTLVQVPNLVHHGWKCISTDVSLVLNVPTELYRYEDPDEFRVEPHGTLPYDWARKDG